MSSASSTAALGQHRNSTRFDRRLARILDHATSIFCEKGYEGASMRDLARMCGMSLAGLYYYFDSKERLLYLIEKELFEQVTGLLARRLDNASGAEQRFRIFVENHVTFFLSRQSAMRLLARGEDALSGQMGSEIRDLKRRYYRFCIELLEDLKRSKKVQFRSRTAAMGLFGMMNWLHMWYNPKLDGEAAPLANEIGDIFLRGVYASNGAKRAQE